MARALASIRLIKDVQPISGADLIEMIQVDGWKLVAKKGEFTIGQKCIFHEIDSFCPLRPEYEFLRKSSYRKMFDGTEGFRLKTMRMKGQVSQGLALPISIINKPDSLEVIDLEVGMDVTDLLGIRKWEQPIPSCLAGLAIGNFPSFISKTDEERIQNLNIDNLRGVWEVTEKLEGTSCTVYKNDGTIGVCSRTLELQHNEDNTYWKTTKVVRDFLEKCDQNIAIQGEIIGPNIQSNIYKLKEATFNIFNVYDINESRYLCPEERVSFLKKAGLMSLHVPILGTLTIVSQTVEDLLLYAEGKSVLFDTEREGIVLKKGNGSFKCVSNKYLGKEKD